MATVSYTAADLLPGMAGPYNITTNAARMVFSFYTRLVMKVTGTELKFTGTSIYGDSDSAFQFSIDGGVFQAQASRAGSVLTVYTGLSDVQRTVIIRAHPGGDGAVYCARSGNVLDVTGASPAMSVVTNWETLGSTNADVNVAYKADGSGWVPANKPQFGHDDANGTYGPNLTCVHVRGAYTTMALVCLSAVVFVSVDGNEPTQYTTSYGNYYELTGLTGTHDYYVWSSSYNQYENFVLAVGGNTASSNIASKKRLDIFGDSVSRGNGGTNDGVADIMRVAAHFGFVGGSHAQDAETIATLNTRIVAATSAKSYGANDCAILAIGRNGNYTTGQSAFEATVTRLAGIYKTVLVRSVFPEAAIQATVTATNSAMQGWVTGLAFSNVYWIDTSSWASIDRPDTTHPSDVGYSAIVAYEKNAFAAYLGEAPATGTSVCTVWMI